MTRWWRIGLLSVAAAVFAGCGPGRQAETERVGTATTPLTWVEVKKLVASDGQDEDWFGSVAVSGDTAVVGARRAHYSEHPRGAAYVFYRDEGGADNWGEVRELTPSDPEADAFGYSVAISGDVVVVGAPYGDSARGAAYVFYRDEGGADQWGEVSRLSASVEQGPGEFGGSVALSGDVAVVGARYAYPPVMSGAAHVFRRDEGGADQWGEVRRLTAGEPDDLAIFGCSVAVAGDTAVVGAQYGGTPGPGPAGPGAAYIFYRDYGGADNWGEVRKLMASDGQVPDGFGESVAISGDVVVVGAGFKDWPEQNAGAAYVFYRDHGGADAWGEVTRLGASDAEANDWFGRSVGISGGAVIVGAQAESTGGPRAGAAYLFQRDMGGVDGWGELMKLTASDAKADAFFGHSVCASDGVALVGAPASDSQPPSPGAAYVYVLKKTSGETCTDAMECLSGYCVDGVCCNTACGGDDLDDCVACSIAAGAATDGICEAIPDGTLCNDGSLCAQSDSCLAGTCFGANAVVCTALDQCHDIGDCDPQTGVCSDPTKADGSPCDDGDLCTQLDTCQAGVCEGAAPVQCPAPDECHDEGSCDPVTGLCSNPPKPDGAACDDGDLCTAVDSCQSGACRPSALIECVALSECHDVGTCNSETGICSNPVKPDGTPCPGGTCHGGECVPDDGGAPPDGGSGGAEASPGGQGGSAIYGRGCACELGGRPRRSVWPGLVTALLGLGAVRRRRQIAREHGVG